MLVYVFLYLPILVVVIYAFNDSRLVQVWQGFSLRWFGEAWRDRTLRRGLWISVYTAAATAVLATSLGTAAAIGLRNVGRRTRNAFDGFMYMALITPELVAAIASLMFFVTIGLPFGPVAIVITHSIFNTAVVTLIAASTAGRHGSQPGGGRPRPGGHRLGGVPRGDAAAAAPRRRGRCAALLHVLVRRRGALDVRLRARLDDATGRDPLRAAVRAVAQDQRRCGDHSGDHCSRSIVTAQLLLRRGTRRVRVDGSDQVAQ